MYSTAHFVVKDSAIIKYCDEFSKQAKLFKNAVIFRCRQLLAARLKDFNHLSENEKLVLDEFKLTEDKFKAISNKYYLPNYYHFDYLFKITKNVDYYNNLPMQTNQNIIKEVLLEFKAYFLALKSYKKNNTPFTGRPKMPGYCKTDTISFDITNQDAVIRDNKLKLPKTKLKLILGNAKLGTLKEVTIKPFYNTYKICVVTELEDIVPNELDKNNILGIDLGIHNFLTTSNNIGLKPFIINGKIMKSYNYFYNKQIAFYHSKLPKNQFSSKKLLTLHKNRHCYFNDQFHKISTFVIKYCIDNNIGTIIIGKNDGWKNNSKMGSINNQNFCFLPHSNFIKKLEYKAKKYNIELIQTEESYTSQASFLDEDFIPIHSNNNKKEYQFSGKRIKRGAYLTKDGKILNADVNGASNIIRKVKPTAFAKVVDMSYLYREVKKITII